MSILGAKDQGARKVREALVRRLAGLSDLACPLHDRDVLVITYSRICLQRKKINISTVLAG